MIVSLLSEADADGHANSVPTEARIAAGEQSWPQSGCRPSTWAARDERRSLFSLRNLWFTVSVGLTVAIASMSILTGFIRLPSVQFDAPFTGIWDAICSAARVPQRRVYAYLPKLPGVPRDEPKRAADRRDGLADAQHAPCVSCHGAADHKTGTPWLEGQPVAYMRAQLQAFASGERHNDISEQMRNVARQMTPDEIEAAARYYASEP